MKFVPFKATVPVADKVHLVASRSYVSYSKEDLTRKLAENPFTFLHIIHPDVNGDYSGRRLDYFAEVRKTYLKFLEEGVFQEVDQESYYIYKQETALFSFFGVIGGVDVSDYKDGRIKVHEQTLHAREGRFTDYLEVTGINAEPVLLVSQSSSLEDVMLQCMQNAPAFCFTTTDRVKHTLWQVSDAQYLSIIQGDFEKTSDLYIADGHHRSASSVALFDRMKERGGVQGAYNHFMALVLPANQLKIFGFHRLVKFSNLNPSQLKSYLSEKGTLTTCETSPSLQSNSIGIYTKDQWWKLEFNAEGTLDTEWLSKHVLRDYFQIEDERHDKRMSYAEGVVSAEQLMEKVDSGEADVLFCIHPIEVTTMMHVADAGRTLPPKSTYILPKLRSGLVIYSMKDAK